MPVRTGRGRLKPESFVNEDGSMRSHHIIAIAIVLVVGFGVARFFLSSPTAEANVDTLKRFSIMPALLAGRRGDACSSIKRTTRADLRRRTATPRRLSYVPPTTRCRVRPTASPIALRVAPVFRAFAIA